MLKGLSRAKPNCFLFHQCCCKILKSFWHTNDSSVQTRFCLPSVDNGCCPCRWEQRDLTLPSCDPLIPDGISQSVCPGAITSRAWNCCSTRAALQDVPGPLRLSDRQNVCSCCTAGGIPSHFAVYETLPSLAVLTLWGCASCVSFYTQLCSELLTEHGLTPQGCF